MPCWRTLRLPSGANRQVNRTEAFSLARCVTPAESGKAAGESGSTAERLTRVSDDVRRAFEKLDLVVANRARLARATQAAAVPARS
jgi:hypothetical protein